MDFLGLWSFLFFFFAREFRPPSRAPLHPLVCHLWSTEMQASACCKHYAANSMERSTEAERFFFWWRPPRNSGVDPSGAGIALPCGIVGHPLEPVRGPLDARRRAP